MRNKLLLAIVISLASTGAVLAQQVSVNYNHSQDFTQFHTYAWEVTNPNQIANSILAQVAQSDTDKALQAKGLSKVALNANPDLIVIQSGGLRQQADYFSQKHGGTWR